MRIMHISSAVNFGGAEKHVVDLCRGLRARGHDVFLALRPTNNWQSRVDYLSSENIFHVSIRNSFGVFSAKRIGEFARENEIDIIHAHVARDYIPASIAATASKRAKFVLTRHMLFPLKSFNRFALRNLSIAIAVSGGVEQSLRNVFLPEKIRMIPNGIDLSSDAEDELERRGQAFRVFHNISRDTVLIGTVGELTPIKGQRDLILAAAENAKTRPDVRFVIVGVDNSASQSFRRELKRLARVLDIENKIVWLDWVDDLPALLAALDIYVSPSRSESFGIATLEAMAAGKPVVATSTAGSRELLRSDDLLVPVEDPVALSRAIESFLNDAKKRDDAGRRLRERAFREFSLERMVESVESLYREILGI